MKVAKKEIERRMARFKEACKASGAKVTHQRIEIFREVAQSGDHPNAEMVFLGVRKRMPTISMDTVYRTLWWFEKLGLITTLEPSRGATQFDANLSHHHHFVCVQCGLMQDFYSDKLDNLPLPESLQSFGNVKTTQVEAKGVCRRCAS